MYGNSMASTQSQNLLEAITTWQKPCWYCLQSKKVIELTCAWELNGISSITKIYQKLELLHGKNDTTMFEKKEGHRAYITRNSMEFYPS